MTPEQPAPTHDARLEQEQQSKYRFYYRAEHLDLTRLDPGHYFAKLAMLRLNLVHDLYTGGTVLDVGCGAGDYLLPASEYAAEAVGVDFSPELLAVARTRAAAAGRGNVRCLPGNARSLPLRTESIGLAFSFSALYHIPAVDEVIAECARVLRPGGVAILELGALYSLNTVVCRAYPDTAVPCHVPVARMRAMVRAAGLGLEADRAFQLLPLWGERPRWLRPLLHPAWKRLLAREVGGRLLDEVVSSLPPFRRFAFRHLLICRKPR